MRIWAFDIVGLPEHIVSLGSRLLLQYQTDTNDSPMLISGSIYGLRELSKSSHTSVKFVKRARSNNRPLSPSNGHHAKKTISTLDLEYRGPFLGEQHSTLPYAFVKGSEITTNKEKSGNNTFRCHFVISVEKLGESLVCSVTLPHPEATSKGLMLSHCWQPKVLGSYCGSWRRVDSLFDKDTTTQDTLRYLESGIRIYRKAAVEKEFRLQIVIPESKIQVGSHSFSGFSSRGATGFSRIRNTSSNNGDSQHQQSFDECLGRIEFLPDGTLSGFSCELCNPQICAIRGTWKSKRVQFILKFAVTDQIGTFIYDGKLCTDPVTLDESLTGWWKNIDEDSSANPNYRRGRGQFNWVLKPITRLNSLKRNCVDSGTIRVFTAGRYTMRGVAVDSEGFQYEEIVRLQLHQDGRLTGTCTESLYEGTPYRISGRWSLKKIQYCQPFRMHSETSLYQYVARLDPNGRGIIVHGRWWNMSKDDNDLSGEHGTLSFAIVEARRHWTIHCHPFFPPTFRATAEWLLSSIDVGIQGRLYIVNDTKGGKKPLTFSTDKSASNVWHHVLTFCHEKWFDDETSNTKCDLQKLKRKKSR